MMSTTTLQAKNQRRRRTRAKIYGTLERPRLAVRVSNRHLQAQLIDDARGVTLAAVSTLKVPTGTMTAKATWLGEQIGTSAKKHKVKTVIFDRGSKIYHGRLHALAEAARATGLEF
jgi:large subunit ribosomal protein L18